MLLNAQMEHMNDECWTLGVLTKYSNDALYHWLRNVKPTYLFQDRQWINLNDEQRMIFNILIIREHWALLTIKFWFSWEQNSMKRAFDTFALGRKRRNKLYLRILNGIEVLHGAYKVTKSIISYWFFKSQLILDWNGCI